MMRQMIILALVALSIGANAQQSDHHFSYTDSTTLSSGKIWMVWTDVPNWKQWDKGLKQAILEGEFVTGAKGKLIPDRGPKSRFVLSNVDPGKSYTFDTKIPFGKLVVCRTLEVRNNVTYFTHDVEFTGLLRKFWGRRLGRNYRRMLPDVLAKIKSIAAAK